MTNEAMNNFKINITPLNKYANHHKDDMAQIKKRKRKFFFLFDTFQLNLKEQHEITEYDLGLLMVVMAHQRFREYEETKCYIHYKGKRATPKNLQEMLHLTYAQLKPFKRKMIALNILREDEYGMYLNDDITARGKKTTGKEQFNRVYVDEVLDVYNIIVKEDMEAKEKKQAIKDVGLLFSLIPYMNKTTNELVDEHFNNITMNELKSKLGLGKNADLEERLGRINQAFYDATDKYLIYKLEPVGIREGRNNKRAFRLIVNPRLVFSSKKAVQSKIGAELFGDSETPTKTGYVLTLLTYDGELFFINTNFNYNITVLNKKIQESKQLLFANKVLNCEDIASIQLNKAEQFNDYYSEEIISEDNELKPLPKNEEDTSHYFKDLYLIK